MLHFTRNRQTQNVKKRSKKKKPNKLEPLNDISFGITPDKALLELINRHFNIRLKAITASGFFF